MSRAALTLTLSCFAMFTATAATAADAPETTPAKAGPQELAADFAKMYQQFDAVAEVLNNEDYYNLKNEEVSLWSCGDQAGHIVLAAQMMRGALQSNIDNPDQNTDGVLNAQGKAVMAAGDFPRGVAQAPEAIRPEGKSREEFIELLAAERKAWEALEAMSDKLAALKSRAPHPAFGPLNSAEWVHFVTIHSAHHFAIVRDILTKSGNEEFGKCLHEKATS